MIVSLFAFALLLMPIASSCGETNCCYSIYGAPVCEDCDDGSECVRVENPVPGVYDGYYCKPEPSCSPCTCAGKICGDDGCGNSCGTCPPSSICSPTNPCHRNTITFTCTGGGSTCSQTGSSTTIDNSCTAYCDSGQCSGGSCVVCTDTCASLGYQCGTHTICGVSTYCGSCPSGGSECSSYNPCKRWHYSYTCSGGSCQQSDYWTNDDTCGGCPSGQECSGGSCVDIEGPSPAPPTPDCPTVHDTAGQWTCNNWYNDLKTCGVYDTICDDCGTIVIHFPQDYLYAVWLPEGEWEVRAYANDVTFDEVWGCGSECVNANDFTVKFTDVNMSVLYYVDSEWNPLNSAKLSGMWLRLASDGCPVSRMGPVDGGDFGFDWTEFTCPPDTDCLLAFNWWFGLFGFANNGLYEDDEYIYGKMHLGQARIEWRPAGCTSDNDCDSGQHCCSDGQCHECCNDNDCTNAGTTCEAQGYPNRYALCDLNTHTCSRCGSCSYNSECEPGYCCESIQAGGSGGTQCVQIGTISDDKTKLCNT
jgi:hypothetical protein